MHDNMSIARYALRIVNGIPSTVGAVVDGSWEYGDLEVREKKFRSERKTIKSGNTNEDDLQPFSSRNTSIYSTKSQTPPTAHPPLSHPSPRRGEVSLSRSLTLQTSLHSKIFALVILW